MKRHSHNCVVCLFKKFKIFCCIVIAIKLTYLLLKIAFVKIFKEDLK